MTAVSPVGRCIYCDATGGRLTKEHIIPRSLGGNVTLLKASCDSCAAITRNIEGYAARHIFQDARLAFGIPMKEPRTHVMLQDNGGVESAVPVSLSPGMLSLMHPEPPKILTGKETGTPFGMRLWVSYLGQDHKRKTEILHQQGLPSTIVRELNFYPMVKLLAKIALGFAVYRCGIDGFIPHIRKFILDEPKDWHDYIGGTIPEKSFSSFLVKPDRPLMHLVTVGRTEEKLGISLLVVQLQLFAVLQAPIYTVVVGEMLEAGHQKLGATNQIVYA